VRRSISLGLTTAMAFAALGVASPAEAHQPHPRSSPVPVMTYHKVGPDWKVRTISIDKNANDEVAEENMYNEPPRSGYQYVIVRVRAKKYSSGEGDAWLDLNYNLYGKATHRYYDSGYQVIPDSFYDEPSVDRDGYVTGNILFEVKKDDVAQRLRMVFEDTYDFEHETRVWFDTKPA